MAGVTSGTTSRFTAGEMSASRPNEASTTGSVAACAARETPRLSLNQRGSRPRVRRSRRSVSGVAQATRPAVASVDSWNPASLTSAGSARSSRNAARPSAAAARPLRPDSRARRTTPAIAPARSTDGEAPANTMYEMTAMAVTIARRRRPSRPAIAPTAAATIAMFQPEIATTWLTPAVVKSAATSPVDAIAQADEDPRGESRLGFGEHAGQQLAGIAAPALQQRAGIDGPLQHLHRPGVEGAPRAESLEVSTIRAVRSRPRTSRHGDPVARFDRWIARQRRGDPEPARAAGHGPDRGDLMALARGSDGLDDHRPGPAALRRTRQGRSGRSHARPQRDRQDPDRHREEARCDGREAATGRRAATGPPTATRTPTRWRSPARRPQARRSPPRPPASRFGACQRTATSSRSFSKVFSPRTPRVRSSSTAANGASSRAAMIFSAVAGPIPGSASSSAWVARLRSTGAARNGAGSPGAGRCARGRDRRRVIARRDPHLVAVVERRGEVELALGPARVDARAVSAGRRDEVADPRAGRQAEHAGSRDGTDDLDDDLASGPGAGPRLDAGRARSSRPRRTHPGRQGRAAIHDTAPSGAARERQDEGHHRERDGRHDGRDDLQDRPATATRWRRTSRLAVPPPRAPSIGGRIKHAPRRGRGRFHIALRGGRSWRDDAEHRDVSPRWGHFRRGETSSGPYSGALSCDLSPAT